MISSTILCISGKTHHLYSCVHVCICNLMYSHSQANYGRKEPEYVLRVKEMYHELKLEEAYREYEEKSYARLLEKIAELQTLPRGMFLEFANRIYKRNA